MTRTTTGPELPGLRYLEPLGSGGFSDVYLYEREHPRIKVAVKVLRADVLDDAQRRQFVDEAEVMAELAEHPFIVPVIGAGIADDGRSYLVMRYYPPPDLAARVAAQPMSVPDALRTGIQLASAIETAHQAGIVHRDIKPGNVLVSSYGVPGLTDFGIAGRTVEHASDDNVGVSMPWSPPEVLTGTSNGTITSDVYSLAATVWNLVVGRSPFTIRGGDNSERAMFTRIVHSRPPMTGRADVPGSLDRLLQQAMSKDPGHRPQSALEFARHLQRVEQELRLARTEIVVLEPVPEVSAGSPPTDGHAEERTQPSAGRTVERPAIATTRERSQPGDKQGPARPVMSPVRSQSAQSTKRRPVVVPPESDPTAVTSIKTAHVVDPPSPAPARAGETERRPRRVTTSAGKHADRTVRRPTSTDPQPVEVSVAETQPRRRRLVWVAAATLLLVVVATGALLARAGGPKADTKDLPNGTTASDPGDALGGSVPQPAKPEITATMRDGNAVFTWAAEQADDTYAYQRDDQRGMLAAPAGHRIVIPLAHGSQVCITLLVRREGATPNQAHACQRG